MYIVRDKKTKKILHTNPAPLRQKLTGAEVYHKFDPKTMEIGRANERVLPAHFRINARGEIIPLTLQEKVDAGVLELNLEQKISGNKIVQKSLVEKVDQGIIKLDPDLKLVGERITKKTLPELLEDKLITLDEFKQRKIEYYASQAFEMRHAILPDYKLVNAALGVYDEDMAASYRATVQAFREEFHRLKRLIGRARSAKAVSAITENYPKAVVVAGGSSSERIR